MYEHKMPGAGTITVTRTAVRDHEMRLVFVWAVSDASDVLLEEGSDLRSGAMLTPTEREMAGSLVSFLSACAESRAYGPDGENRDLFGEALGQWAEQHSDELQLAALELEGDRS